MLSSVSDWCLWLYGVWCNGSISSLIMDTLTSLLAGGWLFTIIVLFGFIKYAIKFYPRIDQQQSAAAVKKDSNAVAAKQSETKASAAAVVSKDANDLVGSVVEKATQKVDRFGFSKRPSILPEAGTLVPGSAEFATGEHDCNFWPNPIFLHSEIFVCEIKTIFFFFFIS